MFYSADGDVEQYSTLEWTFITCETLPHGQCLSSERVIMFQHVGASLFMVDTSPDGIRLNIIKEPVSHKDLYLNKEYLSIGIACPQKNILKSFAMYSDEYEHGAVLTKTVIDNIYVQEVISIRKRKTFMGI